MCAPGPCYEIFGHTVATNMEFPDLEPVEARAPDFTFTVCAARPAVLRYEQDRSVCGPRSIAGDDFAFAVVNDGLTERSQGLAAHEDTRAALAYGGVAAAA